jgi:hypothetical protein
VRRRSLVRGLKDEPTGSGDCLSQSALGVAARSFGPARRDDRVDVNDRAARRVESRSTFIASVPGQALVEWAVAIVVLYLCLAGVDFGRAYSAYIGLTNAAREGARYAVLLPNASDAEIRAKVRAEQPALGVTDAMVTVDRSLSDRRTVIIAYPFIPFTPLVGRLGDGTTLTLRTWAAMPVMQS